VHEWLGLAFALPLFVTATVVAVDCHGSAPLPAAGQGHMVNVRLAPTWRHALARTSLLVGMVAKVRL